MNKREVYWTLCNFGIAYMFIQIGYFGLESLQSTLNFRSGLGTTCIGVLNGCAVISNLFVGPILVRRLTPKRALFVSFLAHTVYIIANFFPSWATLVPASALVGFTQSMSGIVYGVYITSLSCHHSAAVATQRRLRHEEHYAIRRTVTSADSEIVDPLMTSDLAKPKKNCESSKSLMEETKVLLENGQNSEAKSPNEKACHLVDNHNKNTLEESNLIDDSEKNRSEICNQESNANNNYYKTSLDKQEEDESVGFEAETNLEELTEGESDFDNPATQKTFTRFNSIVITFLTAGGLLGNITSSLVLGRGGSMANKSQVEEFDTFVSTSSVEDLTWDGHKNIAFGEISPSSVESIQWVNHSSAVPQKICGIDHCPALLEQEGQEIVEPERYLIYILLSIYLFCNIVGLVLTVVLRPMYNERGRALEQTAAAAGKELKDGSSADEEAGDGGCRGFCSILSSLTDTLRLLGNVHLLLTIVPLFWVGVVMSMMVGAFTQSFIGCSLGVAYVGYAITSLRLTFVVTSHVAARMLHCLHRRYLILTSMLLTLLIIISWLFLPSYEGAGTLLTCCALIGCSIGIFKTVFYGLFPLLFSDNLESALAHNSVWDCLGLSAAFIASDHLCFRLKAYISIVLTVLAMISYSTLEFIIRPRKSTKVDEDSSDTPNAA